MFSARSVHDRDFVIMWLIFNKIRLLCSGADTAMDDARSSVLYINPQGIARNALAKFKTTFLNSMSGDMFVVEERSLSFRDLLAKTRHDAREAGVDCPGFLVLDKESAAKHAVLFVEASARVDGPSPTVKGMECRYPSAATTRKFYCAIE